MSVVQLHRASDVEDRVDKVERRFHQLAARLAAGSIDLRDATTELYDIHTRRVTLDAQRRTEDLPGNVADAVVVNAATGAILECEVDRALSEPVLRMAERRLGQVLVLPCGRNVGAKLRVPAEKPAPLLERDLW